jgi:UDP-3-O-[3-hydroxymyristoyl] glucosamine N-acyltransferase
VASKSGVTKDITKPGTYVGFPAEPARGFWAQQAALRRLLRMAKKRKLPAAKSRDDKVK